MNNGLPNKRIKIEQFEDWDYVSIRTGYCRTKIDGDFVQVIFVYAVYCC